MLAAKHSTMKYEEKDESLNEETVQELIHEDIKGEIELDDFDDNTPPEY